MPKLAKATKTARDLGAIRGIGKHLASREVIIIDRVRYTPASLAAVFEGHLRAMARVEQTTLARLAAIEEERALEAEVARLHAGVKRLAGSMLGERSAAIRDFGIEPDREPVMTAETKKRANEKRQETRRRRGIVGKRAKRRAGG